MTTVAEILAILDQIAPPELAEDYDNIGLLAGRMDAPVETILTALDLTAGVIEEAVRAGAQLIVTHHPILFHARKSLREDDPEGDTLARLIRAKLALIAVHTNFDNAPWGTSDVLVEAINLQDIQPLEHGLRMGEASTPMTPRAFQAHIEAVLGGTARLYAASGKPLRRVAVCGGAGGQFYDIALRAGVELYVTGEVHHHEALLATTCGMNVIEAGHAETERIAINSLADCLQKRLDALQYTVRVVKSERAPFAPN